MYRYLTQEAESSFLLIVPKRLVNQSAMDQGLLLPPTQLASVLKHMSLAPAGTLELAFAAHTSVSTDSLRAPPRLLGGLPVGKLCPRVWKNSSPALCVYVCLSWVLGLVPAQRAVETTFSGS